MIKIENVNKSFGDFKALTDLSLHVPKGAVYGLVGPNGAGKSTMLRCLTGVYRQDSGKIMIAGEEVYDNIALKQRFAYIPDDFFFFTQANTLDMMKYYKGLYKNFDEQLFNKITQCFPDIKLKSNVRTLSKGMQKQVAFMLCLCTRPDVLILDEPVDGLDPVMRRQIWSLVMNDVSEHGLTVLVSSHNLRELEDVCDHVGIMSHGKLVLERSLEELQSSIYKLQVAFEDDYVTFPEDLNIMHQSKLGRVYSLIVKGDLEQVREKLTDLKPIFIDVLPLSLEEIFIYELGGEDYAVRDIIF